MLNIREIVRDAKRIGITGHEKPDGDCIGSTLGLYNYIKKIVPEDTQVDILLDELGDRYSYLKGFEAIDPECGEREKYDVFFGLDSSTLDRYAGRRDYFEGAEKSVCIDHHISNAGFGDLSYIDGEASSASELIFRLIPDEELDRDIAICLYSGIISDSGVLQFSCTSPQTLRAAARLLEFDFDFPAIIERSYYEKTYVQNQILGRALIESVTFLDGRAIFSVVSRKMMDFYEAKSKDLDGIVNQLLHTRGVHCAIFLYETGDMQYKVSMRSDEWVDVAEIALLHAGGGHVRAAGCTMQGNYYDVINSLSKSIEEAFDRYEKCITE